MFVPNRQEAGGRLARFKSCGRDRPILPSVTVAATEPKEGTPGCPRRPPDPPRPGRPPRSPAVRLRDHFALLGLALAFPVALMVFNPTLMFERGWEQYVGTAIYVWAVLTLAASCSGSEGDERPSPRPRAAGRAGRSSIADDDRRRPAARGSARLRRPRSGASASTQLMELNREGVGARPGAGRRPVHPDPSTSSTCCRSSASSARSRGSARP